MSIIDAIIIAIIEGLTEFLPVSSTGHMIIASSFLGIHKEEFTKLFEVAIQLGAIFAVVLVYWRKFFRFNEWQFYAKLVVGVLPALLLGYFFSDQIDALLESPVVVAVSLLLGGIILLFVDRAFNNPRIHRDEQISYGNAFVTGLWQCLAMIPGVSRSASSIIGGMQQKMTRNVAAEFSFFLAVPTMCAASAYSLFLKNWGTDVAPVKGFEIILSSQENITAFITGNVVAFVVAILAIKFFISYLTKHGFKIFGWYRIIAGIILLALFAFNVIEH